MNSPEEKWVFVFLFVSGTFQNTLGFSIFFATKYTRRKVKPSLNPVKNEKVNGSDIFEAEIEFCFCFI